MNVTLSKIFKSASEKKYPFLNSDYRYEELDKSDERHPKYVTKKDTGVCMVRKSSSSFSEAAKSGDLTDIRDAFFHVSDNDYVVNLVTREDPGKGGRIDSQYRFPVKARREELAEFRKNRNKADDAVDQVLAHLNRHTYSDPEEEWAQKFVFTAHIESVDNRPKHEVDYFVSCPCSRTNFDISTHVENFGSLGYGQYYSR